MPLLLSDIKSKEGEGSEFKHIHVAPYASTILISCIKSMCIVNASGFGDLGSS